VNFAFVSVLASKGKNELPSNKAKIQKQFFIEGLLVKRTAKAKF
jgi:hypothetical protein